ncbi:MAG: Ada metal-binding domain-containing protein, partial [Acidimicrobiia bacterium]
MDRAYQGVVTTGIYCRPGCSAQPKAENTRGFEFAAAAEAQGFRPCLRCRPDQGPGWSDWLGPSELVCRALHLIGQGALDGVSVEALAARLGVGPRHLRRLFEENVGASPVAIARSRRAHFARRLLDETDLS